MSSPLNRHHVIQSLSEPAQASPLQNPQKAPGIDSGVLVLDSSSQAKKSGTSMPCCLRKLTRLPSASNEEQPMIFLRRAELIGHVELRRSVLLEWCSMFALALELYLERSKTPRGELNSDGGGKFGGGE